MPRRLFEIPIPRAETRHRGEDDHQFFVPQAPLGAQEAGTLPRPRGRRGPQKAEFILMKFIENHIKFEDMLEAVHTFTTRTWQYFVKFIQFYKPYVKE